MPLAGVPSRAWLRIWSVPLGLAALMALGLLALDMPLARWAKTTKPPGLLQELYDVAEAFGNGMGIVLVAWAIAEFDRQRRGAIGRVVLLGLGAGLMANGFKLLVSRMRPRNFDLSIDSALATFVEWFPFLGEPSGEQSFPSAHTATAVGLAVALGSIYPQARRLGWALVAIVALARVGGTAHFFSDVCMGAAVGWLFAAAWLHIPLLRRRLDHLESLCDRWLGPRRKAPSESPAAADRPRRAA